MKPCPICGEQIQDVAVKCRYCGEFLEHPVKRRRKRRSRAWAAWPRKIAFGFVWWFALYMAARMIIGGILGGMAGARNGDNFEAGIAEGLSAFEAVMSRWHAVIIVLSALAAFAGAGFGVLPGTRDDD